jgi:tetratricopeptide (TPR) repeat protein
MSKGLVDYLPTSPTGRILITTRDNRVGQRLTNRGKSFSVRVPVLAEAERLLFSKLPDETYDEEESNSLLRTLECLPLAITQAAAFITENNISLAEYLDLLKDSDLADFLEEDSGDVRRDSENSNSVIKTWRISFDQILRQKPRAAEILSLMAVLDRQSVPKNILEKQGERNIDFITATGTLQAFSLVGSEKGRSTFEMHRLVHRATREWLRSQGTLQYYQQEALKSLESVFVFSDQDGRHGLADLYPHARLVSGYSFSESGDLVRLGNLLSETAAFCSGSLHNNIQASKDFEYAIRLQEEHIGMDSFEAILSRVRKAETHRELEQFAKAQAMFESDLPKLEALLGSTHLDVLLYKMNYAGTLKDNMKEGEAIYRSVLKSAEETGETSSYVYMICMDNLGVNLREQGKLEESRKAHTDALELKKKSLGPEHPSTLLSMVNLGAILSQNRKNAEAHTRETLQIQERVLGAEHPWTLLSLQNLSLDLLRANKLSEAESLALRALMLKEKVMGPNLSTTFLAAETLAQIYVRQNRYEEALPLFHRALEGYNRVLGSEHFRTIDLWWRLMYLPEKYRPEFNVADFPFDHPVTIITHQEQRDGLKGIGQYKAAEEAARAVVKGYRSIREERATAEALQDLGSILVDLDKHEEAEEIFVEAQELAEKVTPDTDMLRYEILQSRAISWQQRKDDDKAMELYGAALEGYSRNKGADHLATVNVQTNMAFCLWNSAQYAASIEIYRDALEKIGKTTKEPTNQSLRMISSISIALDYQGKYEEALPEARKALEGFEKLQGRTHPETVKSIMVLAKILMNLGQYDEAEEYCRQALAIRKENNGPDHQDTWRSMGRLAEILMGAGKLDEAQSYATEVVVLATKNLGADHPVTRGHRELVYEIYRKSRPEEPGEDGSEEEESEPATEEGQYAHSNDDSSDGELGTNIPLFGSDV